MLQFLLALAAMVSAEEQCEGGAPMIDLLYGCDAPDAYATADRICCHNTRYAERFGFLQEDGIDLFDKLDPDVRTVFYDSVCGKPLFVAPIGRSFEDFQSESHKHGWPSFRPEETVAENVIIHTGGRMSSVCGTHLGHNIPDGGGARFCIDLVCIAGQASEEASSGESSIMPGNDTIADEEFDPYLFTSHKDVNGLGIPKWVYMLLYVLLGVVAVLCLGLLARYYKSKTSSSSSHTAHSAAGSEVGLETSSTTKDKRGYSNL